MASLYLTSTAAKGNTAGHKLILAFAGMTKDKIKEDTEKAKEARKGQLAAREIAQGLAQATVDEDHREGLEVVIDMRKAQRRELKKMLKAVAKKSDMARSCYRSTS